VFALEEMRERTVQIYANRVQRFFLQFTLQNYYYNLHKSVNDRMLNQKERRRLSISCDAQDFRGDYVNYRDNFPSRLFSRNRALTTRRSPSPTL